MRKNNHLAAFPWYGGKTYHLDWLLPLINDVPHKTYVESFGGSAAVLLNKNPSKVEIYNDIHGDVVNFFRVLRTQGQELTSLLQLTPYSREEYAESCGDLSALDPLEKARMFFVRARQVRNGLATKATPGRWSYTKKDTRRGRALPVSHWLSAIDGLPDICDRLRDVQVENLDGLDVIQRYDTPDTLHYVDPPYLMSVRTGGENYSHEFDEKQHGEMLDLLISLQGKVVLSGYINDLYPSRLPGWNEYRRTSRLANATLQDGEKKTRQEVIWANFKCNLSGDRWE